MVFLQQFLYNGRIMGRPSINARGLLPTGIYPAADGWVQVGTPLRWEGLCPFAAANHTVWHDLVGLEEPTLAHLQANGHFLDHFVSADGVPL